MIYVLNQDGKPLMPSTRFRHFRQLIREGRAVKISSRPYVVKLLYETPNNVQPIVLGIDPGRTNIGTCAILKDGSPVWEAEAVTRNKEIPKLMKKRKAHRRGKRQHRRQKRQRRAIRHGTTVKKGFKEQKQVTASKSVGVIERVLPGCEKPIRCIGIRNKEARFNNRKREQGWLTPTARQLLLTHVNIVKRIMRYLPVSEIVLEINKFAFMALDNPHIQRWQYQKGPLFGHGSVNEAVDTMQDGHCLLCQKPIEAHHHIIPRSMDGSDTIGNICGLCKKHHVLVHTDEKWQKKLTTRKNGMNKKYGAQNVLNQIIPKLTEELSQLAPTLVTDGRSTKAFRDTHGIPKAHRTDAYCIACSVLEQPSGIVADHPESLHIRQFRRHDRKACKKAMASRKYLLNGEVVAVNRHKAIIDKPGSKEEIKQTEDSLEEYLQRPDAVKPGYLRVQKHPPVYQNMDRILPGAIFSVDGVPKVMVASQGRHNTKDGPKPNYYRFADGTKATPAHCKLICHNAGLVFV